MKNQDEMSFLIYTNWSVFEITATHLPTGISAFQAAEYTGDNWGWQKDQVRELLQEKIKQYNRKPKRKKAA